VIEESGWRLLILLERKESSEPVELFRREIHGHFK